jgi:hypothetical protein
MPDNSRDGRRGEIGRWMLGTDQRNGIPGHLLACLGQERFRRMGLGENIGRTGCQADATTHTSLCIQRRLPGGETNRGNWTGHSATRAASSSVTQIQTAFAIDKEWRASKWKSCHTVVKLW